MSEIHELKAKQDALAEDMGEVKSSLKDISRALDTLARLEEKHSNTQKSVDKLNGRLDDHELRIRNNEIKLASQMWVERIIWVAVAGIISSIIVTFRG
jgi:FtsZ-binding cell division protein ZapB